MSPHEVPKTSMHPAVTGPRNVNVDIHEAVSVCLDFGSIL